jgi:hypothetical protein
MDIGKHAHKISGTMHAGVITIMLDQLRKLSHPKLYHQVITEIKEGIDMRVVDLFYETAIETWI